ncbi:unnamed protein product, partial [Vitis vinifera]
MVLLLVSNLSTQKTRAVEGRLLSSSSSSSRQRYWKIFTTLGMVCKCCDGVGGECTSTWNMSCSNLQFIYKNNVLNLNLRLILPLFFLLFFPLFFLKISKANII